MSCSVLFLNYGLQPPKSLHSENIIETGPKYHMYNIIHIHRLLLHLVYKNNTTDATSGKTTAYHSGEPEFTSGFSNVRIFLSLDFCLVFYRYLFFLFLSVIVSSVLLRFTASDYQFDIFKLVSSCGTIYILMLYTNAYA